MQEILMSILSSNLILLLYDKTSCSYVCCTVWPRATKSSSRCSVTPLSPHSVHKSLLLLTHPIAYHVNPLQPLAQHNLFKTCFSPVSILNAPWAG